MGLGSCQKNEKLTPKHSISSQDRINALETKLERLEQKLQTILKEETKTDFKNSSGSIKSITFRIGTADDRLRIYWSNGNNSDLPCTKEQSIWVCG